MKKISLLSLLIIFCSSLACNAESFPATGSKLKWTPSSASEVSEKANSSGASYGSSMPITLQDPMMNGMMSGYYNMMQGMSGASYNVQEMQKQQSDYAKQQMEPSN